MEMKFLLLPYPCGTKSSKFVLTSFDPEVKGLNRSSPKWMVIQSGTGQYEVDENNRKFRESDLLKLGDR